MTADLSQSDPSITSTINSTDPSLISVLKTIPKRLKKHNLVVIAAGIAFYGLLALVPTLIALMSIYSLVTPVEEVKEQIVGLTENFSDQTSAKLLQDQVTSIAQSTKDGNSGIIGLVLGVVLALFSASGAVAKLMATVGVSYEATEKRKGLKVRGLAYLMTAGAIVGVIILGGLLGALPIVIGKLGLGSALEGLLKFAVYPAAALAMMFGLTVLYRYGPDRSPKTPWKNTGAAVGTLAFLAFVVLFSLYFKVAGEMPPSYGILGSIAALIIFLQLTTIAVLIGAEVNAALEEHRATAEERALATTQSQLANKPTKTSTDAIPLGQAVAGLAAIFVLGKGE